MPGKHRKTVPHRCYLEREIQHRSDTHAVCLCQTPDEAATEIISALGTAEIADLIAALIKQSGINLYEAVDTIAIWSGHHPFTIASPN